MFRIYDFECPICFHVWEEMVSPGEAPSHCGYNAIRLMGAPAYIWGNCDRGGSTAPRRSNNAEPRRREAKRERVTGMLEKQGLHEKNNVNFMDPKEARKR